MKAIRNIIFDFDGTLADTATAIVATMTRTFQDLGIPVPPEADMRQTIGLKLEISLAESTDKMKDETLVAGDTVFDIAMGNGTGCRTCAVTWGNHDIPTLKTANPSCMIDSFRELEDMVKEN